MFKGVCAGDITLEELMNRMANVKRMEMEINNHGAIYKLTAYWVKDLLRVDIKGDKDAKS